ncbi:MAG: PTS sugar transporter subunit IIC [Lachnospiraceae bacterium]|jgi:uncharacterized membrane protein|nr:PTS sugar transporter subunit IIC [Lachnospiraceae bacterium]MBQ4275004.1 PTS sugar transporter subunit IIC [Lachnospiraceae bacterium]MCR4696619.1 PTS sugar transporter subunit IIC [Lachnospiraceae bacterium]
MKKFKDFLKEFFIDGLSGMATGLFATLIIGTIIIQFSLIIPGAVGNYVLLAGKVAQMLTGAGVGCGVAVKLKAKPLTVLSAAVAGMIGAFASKILAGTVLVDGAMTLVGPGEPLGAFLAAISAVYLGKVVAGKTKLDILVTPLCLITAGAAVGLVLGPPISGFMTFVGDMIKYGTQQAPFLMGIIVSVLMGIALTLPISSAAIAVILGLSGIAAGAATVGCCANMVGFAIASFKDNKWNGLFAQGLGTSMLQMPNIVKKPIIWIPAIVASAILGPISTMVFGFENNPTGAGMGTAGLVGPINAFQVMTENGSPVWLVLIEIALLCFILPGVISWLVSLLMRKLGWIKDGDMKI